MERFCLRLALPCGDGGQRGGQQRQGRDQQVDHSSAAWAWGGCALSRLDRGADFTRPTDSGSGRSPRIGHHQARKGECQPECGENQEEQDRQAEQETGRAVGVGPPRDNVEAECWDGTDGPHAEIAPELGVAKLPVRLPSPDSPAKRPKA